MEQKKKLTNAQLEKRIANALIHIDKTKDTESIFFSDKGLRLTVNEDYAIIATGFHRHVFNNFTSSGISRPYLYTKRVIEVANENLKDIDVNGGYSFQKLLEVLKAKEDKSEYNIVTYYEWWCSVIFDGLYSISEDEVGSWLVYFKYINIIATNSILLEEHKEDVTNKQFVEQFISRIKEFTDNVDERELFHALSDEERMKQEIEAIQEQEQEQAMEAQINGSQD
jgi:hypothetical protein